MPIPLRLSFLPPISSAGITVDTVDVNSKKYDFLFGDDQIPILHLSGSSLIPESLTTYKTSVSVLTSFFPWELVVISPQNLSQGGFNWTSLGSLSTYGELDVLNLTSNVRNLFLSGIGINTNRNDYQVTIFEKITGGVVVRNDEVRGSQLVLGLDTTNHGSYVQAGKFGGFRFSRPLIFRFATPIPTEVMRLDTNSFLCIGDDVINAPARLTIKGNISASTGFNTFTGSSSGGSISAMALNEEGSYFAGPLCIGTSMLTRNPGLIYGNISTIDAIVVGGGGGGGAFGGGGGGGGLLGGTYAVTPGTYTVTVGGGGTAGTFNGSVYSPGGDGGTSLISGLVSVNGGGGGGNWPNGTGRSGSAGGGGGGTGLGGTGIPGLGFNGGNGGSASTSPYRGQGGGGGAGAPGQAGNQGTGGVIGGNGGAGVSNNITGTTLFYGGGGGGMTMGNSTGIGNTVLAQGGQGGGGSSGRFYTPTVGAQSGTANTGGGGGAGTGSAGQLAGAGGSGVVIIRYGGYQRALGGDVVYNAIINGTIYTIHEFRTPGTSNFTVLDTSLFDNSPALVVIGSVSGTGTLSATKDGTFAFNTLSGTLGIGTNTFEDRNLRLAVIGNLTTDKELVGNVTTQSGGLSVTNSTQHVFLGSKLGVGPNSYTDAANGLTVVGSVSATGTLSATGRGFSFIGGNVGINMPNTATTLSNVTNQKLTVVGNISATGSLSATNSNLHNFMGGILAVGDRYNLGGRPLYNNIEGFNDIVYSNITDSSNRVYYGGNFTTYNNSAAARIVRLDVIGNIDTSFVIGGGFDRNVHALAFDTSGNLYVGGGFLLYNGASNPGIIRLLPTGVKDAAFVNGTGVTGGLASVSAITVDSTNNVFIGGNFTAFKGTAANNIVKVNSVGTIDATFNYGTGFNGNVQTILLDTTTTGILVGGNFTTYRGTAANRIVKIAANGNIDTTLNYGTGFNDLVRTIAVDVSGSMYIGGDFTTYNGTAANRIVKILSGGNIDPLFSYGTGFNASVKEIVLRNNRLFVAGDFTTFKGTTRNRYAQIDLSGNLTTPFGTDTGFNNSVETFSFDSLNRIYYAGNFTQYRIFPSTRVIRLSSDGFTSDNINETPPPAFQRLTVQGSISGTGSLSATSSNFNYLAGKVGIGTNTFEGLNLQLAVIGSISATGGLSATDSNAFNFIRGYTNIGPNNRQRYTDRSFFWNSGITVGTTSTLNVLKNGTGALSSVVVAGRSSSPYFYYSSNNTNWYPSSEPVGVTSIRDIANGNVFVAIENGPSSKTYVSTNGQSWTNGGALPLSIDWGGVGFGNGKYIATGSNASTKSAYSINNGNNWSLGGELPGLGNWSSPAYNPAYNSWICCRNAFWDGVAYSNNDGITWIQKFVGLSLDWSKIIFVPPNIYVMLAASDNKIAYSTNDGDTWAVINLPVSNNYTNLSFNQIRNFFYVMLTSVNSNRVLVADTTNLNNWTEVTTLPGIKDWVTITGSASGFLAGASDLTTTYGNFIIDDQRHLNVIGTVSATGALSASGPGFSFIGGPVMIGGKGPTAALQADRPTFGQALTVVGNISSTGALSAVDSGGVSFLGGDLGLGTNQTFGQRLTLLGNISSTGALSANDFNLYNFIAGNVGIGTSINNGQKLTVIGSVSARGSLSATDTRGFSYIGGSVLIGGKTPTSSPLQDRPTYGQKLTVVGNISSTGALSAVDSGGVSVFGGLGIGVNNVPYRHALTVVGNISSTGTLSATEGRAIANSFNLLGGQVGIGVNQINDPTIELAVIGSISATGSLFAQSTFPGTDTFNYIAGSMQVGPILQSAPAYDTKLSVVGNISATGSLSATGLTPANFIGRHLHVGPVGNNVAIQNWNNPAAGTGSLTVVGNISATGSLSAISDPLRFTYSILNGQVGIGTNNFENRNLQLAVIGGMILSAISAADFPSNSYFGSRVGIGPMSEQTYTSTGLAVVGSISATGNLSAVDTYTSYMSSRLIITSQQAFGHPSTVSFLFNPGLMVTGAISGNAGLSARTIYVDPLMSSGTPYTYSTNTITSLTLPTGYNYIKIMGIGGGGGGGSGRKDSNTTAPKYGDGGGGGGSYAEVILPLKKLSSSTLWVTAGQGGVGGAAQATNATNGIGGQNGAATVVAVGAVQATATPILIARGGNGGYGGTNSQDTSKGGLAGSRSGGGNGSDPILFTLNSGSVTDYIAFEYASESSEYGGSGGGAGGSVNAANNNTFSLFGLSALPGGTGGGNNQISRNGQANIAGAAGVNVVTIGANSENIWGGSGGGGGGATITTTAAGAGGAGASPGGGGGGGGASGNATGNSGAGGNGGTGYLRIILF